MNKVVTINLGGRAYQLEEAAYDALRTYLDQARATLANNPDKEEIIEDIEAATGLKCGALLNEHKTVITKHDMDQVLTEMGPVNSPTEDGATQEEKSKDTSEPKRLYRIQEGAVIAGVCNGIAAYINFDVTLVRILFVVLTFFTSGFGILIYIIMWLVMPTARTPQEHAEAHGMSPITAQDLINRAKEGYEQAKNSGEWKKWKHQMRAQKNHLKKQWKHDHRKYRYQYEYAKPRERSPFWELMEVMGALMWILLVAFIIWLMYQHVPSVQQFIDTLGVAWNNLMYSLAESLDK